MSVPSLEHVRDPMAAGSWIVSRLAPFGSCVGALVPLGFAAYMRIAHGEATPSRSGVPRDILEAICNRLTGHPASRKCWFGLWGGYGWESDLLSIGRPDGVPVDPAVVRAVEADAQKPAFGPEVLRGPKLRLPFRNYMLFRGPREGADAFPAYHGQSIGPDLMWPRDRSWFIATDTDLDFTYVAGSHAVIGDLATDERLAAEVLDSDAPLEPDDR